MSTEGASSGRDRGLAIAVLVAMAGGIVVVLGDVAAVPATVVLAAAFAFVGGILTFGLIAYRDARSSGSGFGTALARSLRTAGRALVALMP